MKKRNMDINILKTSFMTILTVLFISLTAKGETDIFVATAYCPCHICTNKYTTDPYYGITASGTKAKQGRTVAINWLPFGTRVLIDGFLYVVEDRGAKSEFGTRNNPKKRVDIFCYSHESARYLGRRTVNVKVL